MTVDGNALTFDQQPIMDSDRVMVPIRTIFEALGYTVDWDQATQTGTATRTETTAPKPGLQNADTLVFLSGGVDIENFGSAAWTGGSVK